MTKAGWGMIAASLVAGLLVVGWGWSYYRWHDSTVGYKSQITNLEQALRLSNEAKGVAEGQVAGFKEYLVTHSTPVLDDKYKTGYRLPIADMLPPYETAGMMPGANRSYRGGVHEGIDFAVVTGTSVRAVGDGRIIRIDKNYTEPSKAELDSLSALTQQIQFTPEDIFDTFRGRQVWLLLAGNVIVRYCHLSEVENLVLGQTVVAGTVVGKSGNSGTIDGAKHLHLEIRTGDTFLGSGLPYAEMVKTTKHFFAASQ